MLLLPLGNFSILSYLKEYSKLRLLIDDIVNSAMFAGALVSYSLLPYVTISNLEKKENQKFELQKDCSLSKLLIWSTY